jgi:hypothetical protein
MTEIADRCPYRRPFPTGFDECPAYRPVEFLPADSFDQPLEPAWTCAHLVVGSRPEGGVYPRCRLGDAAAREAWGAELRPRRE